MRKILILYTSIGQGHKSIAENIAWHLGSAGYETRLLDILKHENSTLGNFGTALYQRMVQWFPLIWEWLYTSRLVSALARPLRVPLASRNANKTLQTIKEFQPDLVITTQITASAVISSLKKQGLYGGLFIIAFSDFHFHEMWTYPNADGYLVNIEEQKGAMVNMGISWEKVFVCGMTLKPKVSLDARAIKERLGIDTDEKVILVSAGSLGYFFPVKLLAELSKTENASVLVTCGKNNQLKQELETRFKSNSKVKIFGFYEPFTELLGVADVFVTKPGGLSVAESLNYSIPNFITHTMPGQEKFNLEYLVRNGLCVDLQNKSGEGIVAAIKQELYNHAVKTSLETSEQRAKLLRLGEKINPAIRAIDSLFHNV